MKTRSIIYMVMTLLICGALTMGCGEGNQPIGGEQSVASDNPETQIPLNREQQTDARGNVNRSTDVPDSKQTAAQDSRQADGPEIDFKDDIEDANGSIYVDGRELSVIFNISREDTRYWEYYIESGDEVFTPLSNDPPGKASQDTHSWTFEAVNPGTAVMEFVLYEDDDTPVGEGYRFEFDVSDDMLITTGANYSDITSQTVYEEPEPETAADDEIYAMLSVILAEVYETEDVSFSVSPYTVEVLGEDTAYYRAECGDGRQCGFVILSDGSVYINENEDTPDFKEIILGNIIIIGEPINDYSFLDNETYLQEIVNDLFENPGDVLSPVENEEGNLIIDHRQVTIYGIGYEFDVGAYIAIDRTVEYVYIDTNANGQYMRVLRSIEEGYWYADHEVSVFSGL
ncbi:MAG: protease inhibitor I42 family protein [Clostridiales bacterium]|jgi:hypothetical protein|nr:protease inhibitor I42 family protein [Clostridiales bacterium]